MGFPRDFSRLRANRAAAVHLSIIGGALFALLAWNYQLDIFGLLFSHRGVTAGASYTDVHAQYGAYQVLTVTALAGGGAHRQRVRSQAVADGRPGCALAAGAHRGRRIIPVLCSNSR